MPINKANYPPNWKEISTAAKERAGWCCEWCGVPHKAVIQRKPSRVGEKDWVEVEFVINALNCYEKTADMSWHRLRFFGLTKAILTTAHLDRDTCNNVAENLAALCQRCHLGHDILQHVANRRYGREHKREHQLKLFTQ